MPALRRSARLAGIKRPQDDALAEEALREATDDSLEATMPLKRKLGTEDAGNAILSNGKAKRLRLDRGRRTRSTGLGK